MLIPRWIDVERVTFKYGLGDEFINVLRRCTSSASCRPTPVDVRGSGVAPRRRRRGLPNPAELGDEIHGRTCAGTLVKGDRHGRRPRARRTCTTSSTTPGR